MARAWIGAALLLAWITLGFGYAHAVVLTVPQDFSIETSGKAGTAVIRIDKTAMTVRDPLAEPIYGSGDVLGFSDDLYYIMGLTALGAAEPISAIALRYTFFTSGDATMFGGVDESVPIAVISHQIIIPVGIVEIYAFTAALKHYNIGGGPTIVQLELDADMLATPAPAAFALFASVIGLFTLYR